MSIIWITNHDDHIYILSGVLFLYWLFMWDKRMTIVKMCEMHTWISVDKKLPKILERVLIYFEGEILTASIATIIDGNVNWRVTGLMGRVYPTHWMPLPEEPSCESVPERIKREWGESKSIYETISDLLDYLIDKEKK